MLTNTIYSSVLICVVEINLKTPYPIYLFLHKQSIVLIFIVDPYIFKQTHYAKS